MKCTEFDTNIAAYMEGRLDDDLRRLMDEHRAACPECARLFKAHSIIMKSLDAAEPVSAPEGLADRIFARIEAEAYLVEPFPAETSTAAGAALKPGAVFNCETFQEHIAAYVDGLLEGKLIAAMNEHRAGCPACDLLIRVHDFVVTSLNTAEPVKAPRSLIKRILAAVEALEAESKARSFRVFPRYGVVAALVAGAGSFLAALIFMSEDLLKSLPDYTEELNQFTTLKGQVILTFLQMYNWVTTSNIVTYLQDTKKFLLEPVHIPMLTFAMPVYYLGMIGVISLAAWFYFREPDISGIPVMSSGHGFHA